jgi:hypothetical protein
MAKQGREYWTKVIAELEQSGLTHQDFATKREVSIHGLRMWLYRLRRERGGSGRKSKGLRLLPVRVRRAQIVPERSVLELAINGIAVRFVDGTSVQYVAELAGALRDRC